MLLLDVLVLDLDLVVGRITLHSHPHLRFGVAADHIGLGTVVQCLALHLHLVFHRIRNRG